MYSVFGSGGSRYSVTPAASRTSVQHFAAMCSGNSSVERPPIRVSASSRSGRPFEITAYLVDQAEPDLVRYDLVVEDPFFRFGDGHRLGEQVVHLHDIDAAVAHLSA